MNTELRYGKIKFLSFLLIDIICLMMSSEISLWLYLGHTDVDYTYANHLEVMIIMAIIDVCVTFVFSSLRRVLRWGKQREIYESGRHILYSLIILVLILFLTKSGAEYSRVVVISTYVLDYVLICVFRTIWRYILSRCCIKSNKSKVLLMTTERFADEGIEKLNELGFDVRYVFLLKNMNKEEINGISVIEDAKEVVAAICWEMIEGIYIYGMDHQMVPECILKACKEMNLDFNLVDFSYRVIDVKTVRDENSMYGALSFLEGKRDIPFQIRRAYWITETEAEFHRGFHAHKLNCQFLFCPYGEIDVILDDGVNKSIVTLDCPEKGLILMPGLWREMIWKRTGSVLCVLASEYYDAKEYIRDYDEFLSYSTEYHKSTR